MDNYTFNVYYFKDLKDTMEEDTGESFSSIGVLEITPGALKKLDSGFIPNESTYKLVGLEKFSEESTYSVGDFVYYNELIYRCIMDVDQPDIFDPECWEVISLLDYLAAVQGSAVSDVQVDGNSVIVSGVANILTNTAYDASTNKIATMSDIPSVPQAPNVVILTQAEYDALTTYADNTEYHIIEG